MCGGVGCGGLCVGMSGWVGVWVWVAGVVTFSGNWEELLTQDLLCGFEQLLTLPGPPFHHPGDGSFPRPELQAIRHHPRAGESRVGLPAEFLSLPPWRDGPEQPCRALLPLPGTQGSLPTPVGEARQGVSRASWGAVGPIHPCWENPLLRPHSRPPPLGPTQPVTSPSLHGSPGSWCWHSRQCCNLPPLPPLSSPKAVLLPPLQTAPQPSFTVLL